MQCNIRYKIDRLSALTTPCGSYNSHASSTGGGSNPLQSSAPMISDTQMFDPRQVPVMSGCKGLSTAIMWRCFGCAIEVHMEHQDPPCQAALHAQPALSLSRAMLGRHNLQQVR